MNNFLGRLMPFIMIGIALVAFTLGLLLLAYLLVFGAVIGLGLFLISWVREKFFASKQMTKSEPERRGRTIEHDDKQ